MQIALIVLGLLLLLFLVSLTRPGRGIRQLMMARMYDRVQARYEPHVAERKRALLSNVAGTVLEIGPGTGCNLDYLPDTVERWIGIEPNPHMHAQLRAAVGERGLQAEFRAISTEGMEVEPDSVDVVLSTLVLCSVPDPETVVRDIRRILKPGGRFVFIEHVAAPRHSKLRLLQKISKPFQWYFANGCRPDRELGGVIRGAGFAEVQLEEFMLPRDATVATVRPHIAGYALR